MYINASAPDAPPFSDTTIGCFIRLFFWIEACLIRAIWSDAPPAPAATTISTGLIGSQASAGLLIASTAKAAVVFIQFRICFVPVFLADLRALCGRWPADTSKSARLGLRLSPQCLHQHRHSGMRPLRRRPGITASGNYFPLKLGVRLLRKASM